MKRRTRPKHQLQLGLVILLSKIKMEIMLPLYKIEILEMI